MVDGTMVQQCKGGIMNFNEMTKEEKDGFMFGVFLVSIVLITFGPLVTIWAINQLFGTSIAYTFLNWLATFWLGGLIISKSSYYNNFMKNG